MEYIDLGLSVKWANCNVGANLPKEFGAYFNREESKQIPNITIPTKEQWEELQRNCKCVLDKEKKGYIVTGKNGNSIYLPLAGEGNNNPDVRVMGVFFWSSTDTKVTSLPYTWYASFTIKGRSDINLLSPTKYFISVRGVQ